MNRTAIRFCGIIQALRRRRFYGAVRLDRRRKFSIGIGVASVALAVTTAIGIEATN